jgi:hypothetical protein
VKRPPDWPERLAKAIEAARNAPFSEVYHCAAFAADVVLAVTETDPLAPYRGLSLADAYAAMRRDGHETLRDALGALVGPEIGPHLARRADVLLRRSDGSDAVGICLGQQGAFVGDDGLVFQPTLESVAAFRVG